VPGPLHLTPKRAQKVITDVTSSPAENYEREITVPDRSPATITLSHKKSDRERTVDIRDMHPFIAYNLRRQGKEGQRAGDPERRSQKRLEDLVAVWEKEREGLKADWKQEWEGLRADWNQAREGLKADWKQEREGLKANWKQERESLKGDWKQEREHLKGDWEKEREGLKAD
jgi:hypothetical protein